MTDIEFQILDELYFMQPYSHLVKNIGLTDSSLSAGLLSLLEKGWVRCYTSPNEEVDFRHCDYRNNYWSLYFLASKKGLIAHNSNG